MSEDTKKLEKAVEYQKEFEKAYPDFWKMLNCYSWNDSVPLFTMTHGDLEFRFYYDKRNKKVSDVSIRVVNNELYEEFAQNPVQFLQKQVLNVPVVQNNDKAVIDFAQETILKAIKGA